MVPKTARAIALALLLLAWSGAAASQQILIDQGAKVGDLWCFPSAVDPSDWYYVPSTAQLVVENGLPSFSFLRYVINRVSEAGGGAQGITEAEGGGILHFLVTYRTPASEVRRAERELQARNPDDEELRLRGPVIFKEGRYALVSSIINPAGEEEPVLLARGNAPVFEGSQIALSFELPPERATLLLESLKMKTPDISLVFEMELEGLTDAYDADLVVRWDEVNKDEAYGAIGALPIVIPIGSAPLFPGSVGGDIGNVFESLLQSKAVELRTRGASPDMEKLLDKVYSKLLDLLFELDTAADVAPPAQSPKDEFGRRPITGFGVSAGYKTKEVKHSGETVIQLNQKAPITRVSTIGFNVGPLWERYEDDERIFKTVNLADPAFQQREIHVGIDGAILPEFESYINSVSTILRKEHQDGQTTVREVVVSRETFERPKADFRMVYGWSGDEDRSEWLEYEYRTRWSFKGGGTYETDWRTSEANMIDLYAPYRRKVVRIMGDHEYLQEQGIRAVVVEIDYPFFAERKKDKLRLRPNEPIDGKELELTLPLDTRSYHYTITWISGTGQKLEEQGEDATGILFVDEPPLEAVAGTEAGS